MYDSALLTGWLARPLGNDYSCCLLELFASIAVSFCSACAQLFWHSLFAASISLRLVSVALLGCEFRCVLEEFLLLPCEEMLRSHYIFMLL